MQQNNITMKDLVIFDLDGTLLYTLEDLKDSVNCCMSHYGYPQRTLDEICSFVGNGVKQLVKLSLPEDITEDKFDTCYEFFKTHYAAHCCDKTKPYDGIIEVLKCLKTEGKKIAIVSNKFHDAAVEVCEHYFKGLYDMVVGESETVRRKPHPDGIFKILETFGIEKKHAIMFGDSEVDFKTSANAGIDFVAVLWGFRDEKFLRANGITSMIHNTNDIISIVNNN